MEKPTSFTSDDLFIIRRNRWALALICLSATILGGIVLGHTPMGLVLSPGLCGAIGFLFAYAANPWPVVKPTLVRADPEGIQIGALRVPRGEIRAGLMLPGPAPRVELRRHGKLSIVLQGGTPKAQRRLLRVLGLDASQSVATFRTLSRALARRRYLAVAVLVLCAVYSAVHAPAVPVVLGLAVLAMLVVALAPTQLDVGADGVMLSWFGRKRFIGYGDVEGVRPYEIGWGNQRTSGVSLTLRGGEDVLIPISHGRRSDNVAIIEERIRQAMEVHREGGGAADAALLRRGDRDPGQWVAALRAVGAGANADMRTAPVPRERLFRIVEDPTAAPADRAAAAVAIGGDIDAASRARLRAAAQATAAPRLRIVLEEAAKGEDEAALTEALAEIEAGEGKRARSA